ncbi:hypothetical protein B0H10DRAFT_1953708 [Mycena sp. CBHHK59/15]|nr:hypothetical protein B0H10DRAFT_1953708 [Mycena sp. CBHHK59/15]
MNDPGQRPTRQLSFTPRCPTTAPRRVSEASLVQAIFKRRGKNGKRAHQPIEIFQKRNAAMICEAMNEEGYDLVNEEAMVNDIDDWEDESDETHAARIKEGKAQQM